MAACEHCNQEMLTGSGCSNAHIAIGGQSYAPILHGDENRFDWPTPLGRAVTAGPMPVRSTITGAI